MAKKQKMGRHSIFRGKKNGVRVQGIITKIGGAKFEEEREALAMIFKAITGAPATVVSDADVIEYMARGKRNTRDYLMGESK